MIPAPPDHALQHLHGIRRAVTWLLLVVVVAMLVFIVPLPYPTTTADRVDALNIALDALLNGSSVDTPRGSRPLRERSAAVGNLERLYFRNDAGVPDEVFRSLGLKPIDDNTHVDVDKGDVIVSAGFVDGLGRRSWFLQFDYTFGSEGGVGYEIRIYKSVLAKRVVFVQSWIA